MLLLLYAGRWRRNQVKKANESWESIVARLRANDWGLEEVSERYLYSGAIKATTHGIWAKIDGAKGLWAMYCNAPVLIQLADYAAEHGDGVSEEILESLRSDAFQIRICVLMALAQHVLSRSSVAAEVNAHRATEIYSAMLHRLTMLFQDHSTMLFPRFLAAM
ncbi:MAG TPA: hypothetical protein VM554_12290 [Acidisarcina sp.]|nr:hypothetical protein [Acidisarcina sp.]